MDPRSSSFAGADGPNDNSPFPSRPAPATPPSKALVPLVDEHGRAHGAGRASPERPGPLALAPPVFDDEEEDSDGDDDGPFDFVEPDEALVELAVERSIWQHRRDAARRRRYQGHLDDENARQRERGLRADEATQARKREWEAIAASQFTMDDSSSGLSTSDDSDDEF